MFASRTRGFRLQRQRFSSSWDISTGAAGYDSTFGENIATKTGVDSEEYRSWSKSRLKLPPAMQRAADAPPRSRVVVGDIDDVTERLLAYRGAIGLDLFILRPQVAGTSDSARRR